MQAPTHLETVQEIENLKYQVIVTNIETFSKVGSGFDKLWKINVFTSHVVSIIWDEGHCVSKWGDFRPAYKVQDDFAISSPDTFLST
jgi:superfamily II DNA helicase RecQ